MGLEICEKAADIIRNNVEESLVKSGRVSKGMAKSLMKGAEFDATLHQRSGWLVGGGRAVSKRETIVQDPEI